MRLPALACILLLAACDPFGHPEVPAPRAETRPLPPVTGEQLAWQPGHWDWNGSGYVWAPGIYVPAAGHGPNWVSEYWVRNNGQSEWKPAHWEGR